ncbi:MAG: YIP1 family protein [Planctomycetes bacterium]|nr:YIP1 family protein [Planctomycetota bacterium]
MSVDVAYAIMTHPAEAMRKLRTVKATGVAAATLLGALVSVAVGVAVILTLLTGGLSVFVLPVYVGLSVATGAAAWLFVGGLTHAAAGVMGGYGRIGKFLSAYALAMMPFALCTPVALIVWPVGGWAALALFVVACVCLSLWSWLLTVAGIMEVYGLSAGAALVASLLPCVLIWALPVLAFITISAALIM